MIRFASALIVAAACGSLPAETYMNARGYWLQVVATAYSPLDEFTRDDENNPERRTASGVRTAARPYGIAAPLKSLPIGTRIIIPEGYGYLDRSSAGARVFTVDDTGGIIRQRTLDTGIVHLDLRYRSIAAARAFGSKTMPVFVITDP